MSLRHPVPAWVETLQKRPNDAYEKSPNDAYQKRPNT